MIFARFEALLKRTMGLDAASVGPSTVERAVQSRLLTCQMNAEDYWRHVSGSRSELQELIEAVVVPETWFFRDPQAFAALARLAIEEWLPRRSEMLRVLSLPCATGEEPYTMAMALIDAGLTPAQFRIDAIDISRHALDRARRGVYGRNSFRGKDLGYRDRYFKPADGGYRIADKVRATVDFIQANLFDPAFQPPANRYDFIFCRNLLIYFDAGTQRGAIALLKQLLAEHGVIFVGHAETGLMNGNEFTSVRIPMAFAFRKRPAGSVQPKPEAAPNRAAFKPMAHAPRRPPPPWPRPQPPEPRAAPVSRCPNLDELRSLSDQGRLADAARGCEAHLREHGPSAEAFHLLGLIAEANGDSGSAKTHYRKALYLDPDHRESLGHLALLLRRQGDAAGAKRLGERMRRLDERAIP